MVRLRTLKRFGGRVNMCPKPFFLLTSPSANYPQDFLDALFAFVTYLIQTQSGGQMLMSAGIIPTLLIILGNKKTSQLKVNI